MGKSPMPPKSITEQIPSDDPVHELGLSFVSSITTERVKRVIRAYGDKPQPIPDTGFRVFKLAKSNFPRCEFVPDSKASEEENVAA
jgi:adenine-specific DNA-methyltransferase